MKALFAEAKLWLWPVPSILSDCRQQFSKEIAFAPGPV